jgi:hypothetical protein
MAYTMQNIVDQARLPLNDARKARYSDAYLLTYANSAVKRTYELRPDLLIGTGWAAFTDLTLVGTFPLPDRFAQTVSDYVGGRAELKDEDASSQARAQQLMQLFAAELLA